MTGFGRAARALGAREVIVQAVSVNKRALDVSTALPPAWAELESAVVERVRQVLFRGKINVTIAVSRPGGGGSGHAWDEAAVVSGLERLAALAAQQGIPFQPDAALLWSVAMSQRGEMELPPAPEVSGMIMELVDAALGQLVEMRRREGAALLADMGPRIEALQARVGLISERAPLVPGQHRELLLQRLAQAGLQLDPSDERVCREIALFADRCDISEELTRLRSHLVQLRDCLQAGGEVGRKADFLLQEINREIHTVGSKANDLQIARAVIDFKNEAERIREQMQNVE